MTSAFGIRARSAPDSNNFDRRTPLPIIATGISATRASISSRHAAGSPIGVIPPYSIAVSATARSIGRNDALRTSRIALDQVVDVGAGVGADHAGRDPLLAGALARPPRRSWPSLEQEMS